MVTAQQIVLAGWGIFVLYWFISAWSVKPTQQVKWDVGNLRWVALVLLVGFLVLRDLGLAVPLPRLSFAQVSVLDRMGLASVALTTAGLAVAVLARRTLAGNWSNSVELKQGHELITTGLYAYVRHPIYSGVMLMEVGTVLSTGVPAALVVVLFTLPILLFKMKQEEALMSEHFPDEYPAYRKRVKSLIPFVW